MHIKLRMPAYQPFRFYLVTGTVYRNNADEANAQCKAAWEHDFKHGPHWRSVFPIIHTGVRCDREVCHQCDSWYT